MQTFTTIPEAKEFLVGRIVAQARRSGIPLSDAEEKMMYFSETGWVPDEIYEISAAFDADYDEAEYEEKIVSLIRSVKVSDRRRDSDALERWKAAELLLRTEDHYLLVLIDLASGKKFALGKFAPSDRLGRVLLYGLIGFVVCAVALFVSMRIFT